MRMKNQRRTLLPIIIKDQLTIDDLLPGENLKVNGEEEVAEVRTNQEAERVDGRRFIDVVGLRPTTSIDLRRLVD